MRVRVACAPHACTTPIAYNVPHCTLFRLDNRYGGVFAETVDGGAGGGVLLALDRLGEGAEVRVLVLNRFWRDF